MWNKHPKTKIVFNIIARPVSIEQCLESERVWITYYRSCDRNNGYNMAPVAGTTLGYKYTDEQKRHCSKWVRSPGMRDKIRASRMGSKASEETKANMRETRKGDGNGMFGKKHSQETKDKIRNTRQLKNIGYGCLSAKAKFLECQIAMIRKRIGEGESVINIAEQYGVHKSTIFRIKSNKFWKQVQC